MSIPKMLRSRLKRECSDKLRMISGEIHERNIRKTYFAGSGTPYHAGIASSYFFDYIPKIPSLVILASEFVNYPPRAISKRFQKMEGKYMKVQTILTSRLPYFSI